MSEPVSLRGVRADTPTGCLVALGALEVLTEYADDAARLAWHEVEGGYCAAIAMSGATTSDEVARRVIDALASDPLDGLIGLAPDLNKVSPTGLREVLTGGGAPRLAAALAAEAPLRPDGQVAMTPLAITSFQGKRSVFGTLLRADARLSEEQLRDLFSGPWRYVRDVATLNLDPAAREQDSARMAADASNDGTRGVPGAVSLAARGLALVPPLPAASGRGKRPRVAAVAADRFVWPVWSGPLTRFGVRALMGRSWASLANDAPVLDACGVMAIYESEIVAAKDGRRLARARRLA